MTDPASRRAPRADRVSAILAAACRVIARDGTERLRMSDVAREAGVSSALVHYYFATRSDLLVRAFSYADEQVDLRAESERRPGEAPLAELERLLTGYAADEAVVHENWALWSEMWQHALHHRAVRHVVDDSYRGWIDQVADLIRAARLDGTVGDDVDPLGVAQRLTALIDGLGQQLLLGMVSRERMRDHIRQAIANELRGAEVTTR